VNTTARPVASVLAAAVLFGTAGTAQALGPDGTTPLGVGAARIALASLLLVAFAIFRRRPVDGPLCPVIAANRTLILTGGAGVAMYTPAFFAGVDRAGVAVGTVVAIGSGPFFAGALEWTGRGERPRAGWFAGTVMSIAGGVILVASGNDGATEVEPAGIGFALLAGFGYALYSVTTKLTMERGMDPTLALAAPFTVGAVVVVLLAVRESLDWLGTGDGALMALYLGVMTAGAYVLFGYGLHRLTSATTVTLVLAEPVTAALLAVVLLDETIALLGWLGIVVLLAGLLVVGRTAEVSFEPTDPTSPT